MDSQTQTYIQILEKTNQQLSLWYNPYGLAVGILTALVALLAIIFAWVLWRQGKEYRDIFDKFLKDQRGNAEIEWEQMKVEMESRVNSAIADAGTQLNDATGEAKAKFAQELKALEQVKEKISSYDSAKVSLDNIYNPLSVSSIGIGSAYLPYRSSIHPTFLSDRVGWGIHNARLTDALTPSTQELVSRISELQKEVAELKVKSTKQENKKPV